MNKSEVYINGWFAHKAELAQTNPYNKQFQPYSYNQWLSGWCNRFSAIKYDLDMSLDEINIF